MPTNLSDLRALVERLEDPATEINAFELCEMAATAIRTLQARCEQLEAALRDAIEVLEHVEPTGDDFDLSVAEVVRKGNAARALHDSTAEAV